MAFQRNMAVVVAVLSLCGVVLRLQQRPVEALQRVTTQLSVPYQDKDWSHTGEGHCGPKCMEAWKARVFHLASMDDSKQVAQKALGKRVSSARRGAYRHPLYVCGLCGAVSLAQSMRRLCAAG